MRSKEMYLETIYCSIDHWVLLVAKRKQARSFSLSLSLYLSLSLSLSYKKGHTYMRHLEGSPNTKEVGNPKLVKVRGDYTQLTRKLLPANTQKNSAF
jgi:predicted 2-oxoglutarate/Fe(II)-dependent dioxygenase YbiX